MDWTHEHTGGNCTALFARFPGYTAIATDSIDYAHCPAEGERAALCLYSDADTWCCEPLAETTVDQWSADAAHDAVSRMLASVEG